MIEGILLRVLYLTVAGIVVTQILNRSSISSALFLLTFAFTFLLWLSVSKNRLSSNDLLMLFIIGLAVINVSLNAWFARAGLSFGYLKKVIMFITSLMYLQAVSRLIIDNKTEHFISAVVTILSVFIILAYIVCGRSLYEFNGRITDYLTFHFTNPNLTALFLSCIAFFLLCRCVNKRSYFEEIVLLALFTIIVYFIYKTGSRNALIVIFLFVVISLRLFFGKEKLFHIRKGGAVFIAVFSNVVRDSLYDIC